MSDEQETNTPLPATESEQPKPRVLADALPPDALKARLDQAKLTAVNEILKTMGVSDVEQLKAAVMAAKAAEESKKSDAEKLASKLSELTAAQARISEYENTARLMVERESANLTEQQREAVSAIAGSDPARWLSTLAALAPTWKSTPAQGAPAQSAQPVQPQALSQAPVATAPTGSAPAATNHSPPDHKAIYGELKTKNPILAARYAEKFGNIIFST